MSLNIPPYSELCIYIKQVGEFKLVRPYLVKNCIYATLVGREIEVCVSVGGGRGEVAERGNYEYQIFSKMFSVSYCMNHI